VAGFENPPAEGIYRVWIEPSEEHMRSPITPTDDTDYSAAISDVARERRVFRGNLLGMLSVMRVGERTHVIGLVTVLEVFLAVALPVLLFGLAELSPRLLEVFLSLTAPMVLRL
jgi:hypothetical protein